MQVYSRFLLSLVLAFGVLNLWAPSVMSTPIPAVSFTSPGGVNPGATVTDGWQFSICNTIQVTSLGYYDLGGDGLVASHEIGLWTDTAVLLTSATVDPFDPLDPDSFRYTSITLITLAAGTYLIGAHRNDGDDAIVFSVNGFMTAPGITFEGLRFEFGDSLMFPTGPANSSANPGIFGPNFKLDSAAAIPEPGTLTLLVVGMTALGALLLRNRSRERKENREQAGMNQLPGLAGPVE
jgi:hypothetical protein